MQGAGAGGRGGEELRRFGRLADLTIVATFALILLGGVVRVSESGLGCGPGGSGTDGWPLCGGEVIPVIGGSEVVIEFSHRLLATVVTALIVLMAWRAYRDLHNRRPQTAPPNIRWPLRGSIAAGALVLAQAGLGGLTVEKNLAEELVAAHLGLAMILLGLLLWLSVRSRAELAALEDGAAARHTADASARGARGAEPLPSLRPFAALAVVLLLGAIVAGGVVAGTEEEGVKTAGANANGAQLACGEAFPTCLDDRIFPFGESRMTDIHLTHRALVYGATAAILLLIGMALARGARSRLLAAAAGLLVLQLLLGALNVWLGEHATLVVAHLTVATLLWGTVLLIAYRLAWAPAPAAERARAPRAEVPAAAT